MRKKSRFRIHVKPEVKKRVLKPLFKAGALLAITAVICFGAWMLERQEQHQCQEELLKQQEMKYPTIWTEENTLIFNGDVYGFDHRIETFLFIGTDAGGGIDQRDGGYRGPLADFLMLAVLDHSTDAIGFIEIDRNTITDVRELDMDGNEITSRQLQLCLAHWYGRSPEMAAENTEYAVRQYLGGLHGIDGYYVLNLKNIDQLNHAIGGVEVTIDDDMTNADPELYKGHTLVLTDAQAEKFLRARMDVGKGDNASRMARQRQYMNALFAKVREKTADNPRYAINLYEALRGIGTTDMTGNHFSRIAQQLLKGENKGIRTIGGEIVVGNVLMDGLEHEEFYADDVSIREELTDLFSLVRLESDKNPGDENIAMSEG